MAGTADYRLGPNVFPRGWFMVAASAEVTRVPLAVRFFGQDLVLYRGESGRAYLVDAYCPHMGTHLAKNTTSYVVRDKIQVEGDSIRCPYHAWRFGPDGRCNQIPYHDGKIPAAAKLRTWRLEERYGCLYTWHDTEEGEPDFSLPAIAEWDDPHYVRWEIDQLGILPSHPIELVDNMADVAHLGPTHGTVPAYFHNEIQGVIVRQRQGGQYVSRQFGARLESDTFYTGPGILLSYFNGAAAIMYIAHTPVDDGSVKAWHALLTRFPNEQRTEQDIENARAAQAAMLAGFAQDFEIWSNKRPCIDPMVVQSDGPYAKVRMWYRQFYNARAQAPDFQARASGFYTIKDMPPHNLPSPRECGV